MLNLIPKAEGQKITYKDLEQFQEKIELFNGDFGFTESEKKALLLVYITNFGLEFLIETLPRESLKELKDLLDKKGL
ncbi:hypothetical protein [Aeribacillus alveayuensis]|uniref:Uncharacterized protein n=1 Tax=Aeribacillus alveayuensis TaxID=279215 RepID=A0ABT9VSX7_9BACI|nr:hypothetical protein [Bacillus alveayuensis]